MSCLIALIDWGRSVDRRTDVARMLGAARFRSPDGVWQSRMGEGTVAFGLRLTTARHREFREPIFVDLENELVAACDARFDNLPELGRKLDVRAGEISDAELVARAYRRWGQDAVSHLDGDFAFIVWDRRRQLVYAGRDRFGIRSLHFRTTGPSLVVATEVAQILEEQDSSREIEPRAMLDHLNWEYAHHRLTFFRSILRVQPGHYLVANQSGQNQTRYWRPPQKVLPASSIEECSEQFAAIFREAVTERLASPAPTVMHLSGGLDSSSIVSVAMEALRTNPSLTPSVTALSAMFPGLDCDESEYIHAVREKTGVHVESWDASPGEVSAENLISFDRSAPTGAIEGPGCGPPTDLVIANRLGAVTLLLGEGGNQITTEPMLLETVLRQHNWTGALALAISGAGSGRSAHRVFRQAMQRLWLAKRGLLPPRFASFVRERRRAERWTRRPRPRWLGPTLRAVWPGAPLELDIPSNGFTTPRQEALWGQITSSRQESVMDGCEFAYSRFGVEGRFPFLDTSLAELMLAIPESIAARSPSARGLHKLALGRYLPETVRSRSTPLTFSGAHIAKGLALVGPIRQTLTDGRWACGEFVDRTEALRMLNEILRGPPARSRWRDWRLLQDIAVLELWMRWV